MPKKIRRSNNRLKKTNRKGRKTANHKRSKKLVGGWGEAHWVAGANSHGANSHYTIKQMEECKTQVESEISMLSTSDSLFNKLMRKKLMEINEYLTRRIPECLEWEKSEAQSKEQQQAKAKARKERMLGAEYVPHGTAVAEYKYAHEEQEAKAKAAEKKAAEKKAERGEAGSDTSERQPATYSRTSAVPSNFDDRTGADMWYQRGAHEQDTRFFLHGRPQPLVWE
jgi:selenocysteine-specific translation elongation factor